MNGRIYAVTFTGATVTAAQDLFELTPASNKPIEIVGIELSQTSDFGDSQDELLSISIIRGNATSGSGGSSATPAPISPYDTIAGFTAEVNNTTVASTGTPVTLFSSAWNVRAGYINWFPEGCRPMCNAAYTMIRVTQSAPTDSITMHGTVYIRELI